MTEQIQLSEREYRNLDMDSYSTIKVFLDDRKKYYRKFVLKEDVKENISQENTDVLFGGIVDCLLFTPDEFDDRYIVSIAEKPTGQMEDFVNNMYKFTMEAVNDFGDLTRTITELMEDSYNLLVKGSKTGKLRDSLEKFQERFLINKEGFDYYTELRNRGSRLVITTEEVDNAHKVVDYLLNHSYTRNLLNMVTTERYEVIRQLMITGEIDGLPVKMMADLTIIDHEQKIVNIFDLKVMGNIDIFSYNFLKLKYYIQMAVYTTLVREKYPDYVVHVLRFLTVDKYRYMDPLVIKTSEGDYNQAMNGFTLSGHKYRGLKEAIADIKFHRKTGIWTSSKEAQENDGLVTLKLYDEYDEQS